MPLARLVDDRFIEGTFPVHATDINDQSIEDGVLNRPVLPSLEIAVHLYRMGPLATGHAVSASWRPPSLVEIGHVGEKANGDIVTLFERPPTEESHRGGGRRHPSKEGGVGSGAGIIEQSME